MSYRVVDTTIFAPIFFFFVPFCKAWRLIFLIFARSKNFLTRQFHFYCSLSVYSRSVSQVSFTGNCRSLRKLLLTKTGEYWIRTQVEIYQRFRETSTAKAAVLCNGIRPGNANGIHQMATRLTPVYLVLDPVPRLLLFSMDQYEFLKKIFFFLPVSLLRFSEKNKFHLSNCFLFSISFFLFFIRFPLSTAIPMFPKTFLILLKKFWTIQYLLCPWKIEMDAGQRSSTQ